MVKQGPEVGIYKRKILRKNTLSTKKKCEKKKSKKPSSKSSKKVGLHWLKLLNWLKFVNVTWRRRRRRRRRRRSKTWPARLVKIGVILHALREWAIFANQQQKCWKVNDLKFIWLLLIPVRLFFWSKKSFWEDCPRRFKLYPALICEFQVGFHSICCGLRHFLIRLSGPQTTAHCTMQRKFWIMV